MTTSKTEIRDGIAAGVRESLESMFRDAAAFREVDAVLRGHLKREHGITLGFARRWYVQRDGLNVFNNASYAACIEYALRPLMYTVRGYTVHGTWHDLTPNGPVSEDEAVRLCEQYVQRVAGFAAGGPPFRVGRHVWRDGAGHMWAQMERVDE